MWWDSKPLTLQPGAFNVQDVLPHSSSTRLAEARPRNGSVTLIYGPPGSGKATLTCHLIGSVHEDATFDTIIVCSQRREQYAPVALKARRAVIFDDEYSARSSAVHEALDEQFACFASGQQPPPLCIVLDNQSHSAFTLDDDLHAAVMTTRFYNLWVFLVTDDFSKVPAGVIANLDHMLLTNEVDTMSCLDATLPQLRQSPNIRLAAKTLPKFSWIAYHVDSGYCYTLPAVAVSKDDDHSETVSAAPGSEDDDHSETVSGAPGSEGSGNVVTIRALEYAKAAFYNAVFMAPDAYDDMSTTFRQVPLVNIGTALFTPLPDPIVMPGTVQLGRMQRDAAGVELNQVVTYTLVNVEELPPASSITFTVDMLSSSGSCSLDVENFRQFVARRTLKLARVCKVGQAFAVVSASTPLSIQVVAMRAGRHILHPFARCTEDTVCEFVLAQHLVEGARLTLQYHLAASEPE
jgi:energy-coupling factor transporter ATP-binding protein EcfA2